MGGRGASSDIQNIRDWLSGEGNSGSPPKPMDITKFDGWSLQQTESRRTHWPELMKLKNRDEPHQL